MGKYKLTWKDLSWNDFKTYLFSLFKAFIPPKKISNLDELESFVQSKSAWVTQVTLYGYLKTRMGTRYVLHFENDEFMESVNLAKWNIYAVALQDLTFYTISYLKNEWNFHDTEKSKDIYFEILEEELKNEIPKDIFENAKKEFYKRYENINWTDYYKSLPFNFSALALYNWSPIAEELKTLDKKIVLNSMILKWDNVKKEFIDIINI